MRPTLQFRGMLASQRILLIIGLAFIAWLLNVNHCDWVFNRTVTVLGGASKPDPIICGWESEQAPASNAPANLPRGISAYEVRYTGLITQRGLSKREALYIGVLPPLVLLLAAGYLWLGGRHAGRLSRGLCPKCAYPIGKNPVCTECGTQLPPGPNA